MPPVRWEALLVPLALLWVAGAAGVFVRPWVAAVTAVVLGFLAWRRMIRGVRVGPALFWLLGLATWLLVAALAQPVAWNRAAQLVAIGFFCVLLAVVAAHPAGRQWLTAGVVAAGVLSGAWLGVEWLAVGGRPAGPFGNPNPAATLAVLALAHGPLLGGRLFWVLAPVLLAGVVAAESRAALLAVAGLCGFWLFLKLSRRQRAALGLLGLLAVAGFSWRMFADPDPLRFERVRIWRTALAVAWDFAPWGTGPGGFTEAVLPRNFPREGEFARFHRIPDLAESDLLQVAASLGLPGLLLAGGLVASTIRAWQGRRVAGLAPGLAVAVTSSFHSQLLWPVVAFVAVSAGRFSGRFRLQLASGHAFLLLWPLVGWGALALPWPESGLGPAVQHRLAALKGVLARERDPEKLAGALVEAEEVVRTLPRSAEALRVLAQVHLGLARATGDATAAEAAATAFRRAQALNPLDVWALLGEAEAWVALAQWERAQSAAIRALQLEPNCVPCSLTLAQAKLFSGDPEAARHALRRALAAQRRARGYPFVSAYEHALATPDPVLQARLAAALGEGS